MKRLAGLPTDAQPADEAVDGDSVLLAFVLKMFGDTELLPTVVVLEYGESLPEARQLLLRAAQNFRSGDAMLAITFPKRCDHGVLRRPS